MKKKFELQDDANVYFVDENDGADIDEDVLGDILVAEPSLPLMVLTEGEEWSEYPVVSTVIIM